MTNRTVIAACLACFTLFSSGASAETTSWFTGYGMLTEKGALRGKLLTEIDCRDNNSRSLDLRKSEFKITYVDNTENTKYLWAVGDQVGFYSDLARARGYKLVSLRQYIRKGSGLVVRCAVWHK